MFYWLQERTSGARPGKQTPSSRCTCPRRRRRNALLTKGRIFRAAFPPIKATCLIPSKLQIKGRLFRCCQLIKLQAERRTSVCRLQVDSPLQVLSQGRGWRQVGRISHIWLLLCGSWTFLEKQELLQEDLGKVKTTIWQRNPEIFSLFLASTQRTGCQCSFYFLTPKAQPHVSVCRKSSQHLSSPVIYKPDHEKTIL